MLKQGLLAITAIIGTPGWANDLPQLPPADVIILGETHDNGLHHAGQAEYLKTLSPTAVVFEMLSVEQAEIVNSDPKTDLPQLGKTIGWEAAGWPDFSLYAPIFSALGETPAIAAGTKREVVQRAFGEGAATVFGRDAATFGLDDPLPTAELEARKSMQFEAHCRAMPIEMMAGMVEAQRVRDAVMAQAVLDALEDFGPPVAVIAGSGHAHKIWGVPALLAHAKPDIAVLSVAFVETGNAPDLQAFDIVIPTAPVERDDPCQAFEK